MSNFIKDIQRGKLGELDFITEYPEFKPGKDGYCLHDFTCPITNETVELKTDFYCMNKTPNFFLERYSNYKNKTDGGPWRQGADYFVYYFITNREFFWFNRNAMVTVLNSINLGKLVRIPNGKYDTMGYKVPRDVLANIRIVK